MDVKKPQIIKTKYEKKYRTDLGDDFIAPDGGYGWLIVIACGFSNMCIFPALQTFGLIYRERLLQLGITNSQITTLINTQYAISSCTGLLNGPLFRRYTYRQVAFVGAFLVSLGLFLSSFADSFPLFILSFSCFFGFGMGISISSTTVVINTYFKEKRRRAVSFAWTITGCGPIIMPYIANFLLPIYGYQQTIWFFLGIALQTFVCAMVFHPVQWHTKKKSSEISLENAIISTTNVLGKNEILIENENVCKFCELKNRATLSSNSLNRETSVYKIIENNIPQRSRIDDEWTGSKSSLTTKKKNSITETLNTQKDSFKSKSTIDLSHEYNNKCSCAEKKLISSTDKIKDDSLNENLHLKWYQKLVIFFDLDLLKDPIYIILMFGITFAIFADMNFSVLTPFILKDFEFNESEIASIMSLTGIVDVILRFTLPFCIENINWSNQVFFMIGILILVISRFLISLEPSYYVTLILFSIVGIGKGFRTIFMGLIIPSYVSLERLPAATGLQLLTSGLFALACGPIIGVVRDSSNYSITINFLNVISMITVFVWSIQILYKRFQTSS